MNTLKLLTLGIVVVSLSFTTSAVGQCLGELSLGIEDYLLSNDQEAVCVNGGESIYYIVHVSVSPAQCPISDGLVAITLPDGRFFELDNDCNLPPGGDVFYDTRDRVPGYVDVPYIAVCDDPDAVAEIHCITHKDTGDQSLDSFANESIHCKTPCIEVSKTPNTDITKPGDTVIYEICVHNCSTGDDPSCDLTLYNVQVIDPLLTPIYGSPLPGFPTELEPDQEVCVSFEYGVQPEDPDPLENCVTATGENVDGIQVEDEDCAVVELFQPCVEVTKDCNEVSKVGDTVHYTITLTNCSSPDTPPLAAIAVDSLLGPIFDDILPLGDTVIELERVVQEGDPDPLVNTVTLIASPIGFDNVIEADPPATCQTDLVHPSINLEKTVDNQNPCFGDTVTYTICIENTGDWPLENVVVTDPNLGAGPLPGFPPILFPGEIFCVDFPYVVQESDPCPLENCAEVTSNPLDLSNVIDANDCADICPESCEGGIFCTFTQGYYGNAGGKKCGGLKTPDLIDALLASGGPVVVGIPGHSITLNSSSCIIDLLPAGGTPAVLPAGNFGCPVDGLAPIPNSILKQFKKQASRFNNVLIGQIVALTLNLRLYDIDCAGGDETGNLASWVLPAEFCTIGKDGCITKHTAPTGFVGMTVGEILALANEAIAGVNVGVSLSAINGVISFFNETFDECAEIVTCPIDPVEICDNGCDDDFDGLVDLADPDCLILAEE